MHKCSFVWWGSHQQDPAWPGQAKNTMGWFPAHLGEKDTVSHPHFFFFNFLNFFPRIPVLSSHFHCRWVSRAPAALCCWAAHIQIRKSCFCCRWRQAQRKQVGSSLVARCKALLLGLIFTWSNWVTHLFLYSFPGLRAWPTSYWANFSRKRNVFEALQNANSWETIIFLKKKLQEAKACSIQFLLYLKCTKHKMPEWKHESGIPYIPALFSSSYMRAEKLHLC